MENNVPSAEEILNSNELTGDLKCRNIDLNCMDRSDIIDSMIEFAKLHVKAALEKAYKESFLLCTPYDIEAWKMKLINNQDLEEHEDGFEIEIDKDSILNAYSEDLIK